MTKGDGPVSPMPFHLAWTDLVLRLASTVLGGLIIGYNREEHGKAAGMRTTLIVALAASVTMIQVNALLPLAGRPSDSFVMNDLMRLPLGVLTGVGFIGAGAIVRRSDIVEGVTTAATLWLVTVIGLCFGGGQLVLGWTATGLGLAALWGLGRIERNVPRSHTVRLTVECDSHGPSESALRERLHGVGLRVADCALSLQTGQNSVLSFEVRYVAAAPTDHGTPKIVHDLANERGVVRVDWRGPA